MFPERKHLRYSRYDRLRHSTRFRLWLALQAARIGQTAEAVFALIKSGMSTSEIANMPDGVSNTKMPNITGTDLKSGTVLSVSNGEWSGSPTSYTYTWLRDGVAIADATANSYTLVDADVGKQVSATVTASNATSSATVTIGPVGPILEKA